jgi:hypothetical protein
LDLVQRAAELYARGDLHDALQLAQAACDRRPSDPEAWALLGMIARQAGMPSASEIAFQRAAQLEAGSKGRFRVSRERFTELVLELAPPGSHVHIEEVPSADVVANGTPTDALTHQDPGGGRVIYQSNVEGRAGSESELREVLVEVLGSAR